MSRKKPVCPNCMDKSDVDGNLRCGTCREQLEYKEEDGTLQIAEKERKCPRCSTINNKDVQFCESCGAKIGKYCGYCKTYHFIEAKVCPKTGETLKEEEKKEKGASKLLTFASFFVVLLIGFFLANVLRKPEPVNPVPVVTVTTTATTTIPVQVVSGKSPRIDVVFVIDATGSMGDEIEVVKKEIQQIVRKISSGDPRPDVHYGLVAYRDKGDAFDTRMSHLTDNMNEINSAISDLDADGGGDTPELVGQALHVAVNEMNWDQSANTRKMIFLIGDAGPHTDGNDKYDYREQAQTAKQKGIKIFTIGCSGITSHGEKEFKEIASITNGEFDYLTYQQEYVKQDGTTITILNAGDKAYKQSEEVKGDEWKGGYRILKSKKQATELPSAGMGGGGMMSGARAKGEQRNNLDQMIADQVQMEAESMGVRYKK